MKQIAFCRSDNAVFVLLLAEHYKQEPIYYTMLQLDHTTKDQTGNIPFVMGKTVCLSCLLLFPQNAEGIFRIANFPMLPQIIH